MIAKWKKSALLKAYSSLPLWGKIAVPVGTFFVASFLYAMVKNILLIGLIVGGLYLLASGYFYIKDKA